MNEAHRDRVTKLVGELIAATKADALVWDCYSIAGAAVAHREGITYALNFPSKTSTDRTLSIDQEGVWHGPELNELVGVVTAQERRMYSPPPMIVPSKPDTKAIEAAVDRALKTF